MSALNLSSRPPLIHQAPVIPDSMSTSRKHDLYGGVLDKITLEPNRKSWTCLTPESLVKDCFQYSINSINHEILSASLIIDPKDTNISIVVYEVDELFGELQYVDRFEIRETLDKYHFDISHLFHKWMKQKSSDKMIKIEITNSNTQNVINALSVLRNAPNFDVMVFQPNTVTAGTSDCVGCCVIPFYVNFTEIGWNDWILSPPGFYANVCSDTVCSTESDEVYQFMKAAISDLPEPKCAPNYYGSVDMIVALSPRDIRKTRVHGLRALSCSCT